MKKIFKLTAFIFSLFVFCACSKEAVDELIIDPFTFGKMINWKESDIKAGNQDWAKIENGNTLSWLSEVKENYLQVPSGFAVYNNTINLNTDFVFTIEKDKVFAFQQSSNIIYFLDKDGQKRTDVVGIMRLSPDTTLILQNTAVSPNISIKYKIEN